LFGFWIGSLWLTLASLVALTCQSAFFGPAKYGMIPELVPDSDLSRANGTINMCTNLAVIIGTLVSGIVADRYDPLPGAEGPMAVPSRWLPGLVLLVIAVAGLAAVLFLPALRPGDHNLTYHWSPFTTYRKALREMARGSLLMIALAWGYFYLLAGLGLLIIPEYTLVLEVNREMASRLLGILAISIGVGSVTAGIASGHQIRPRLVLIGTAGLTVFFVLLGTVPPTFGNVGWFLFGAGVCAGFYIIPFQALLQKLSPDDERGRFLGTANAISFFFLSIASILYVVIRPAFGDAPQRIFLVSAVLMAVGAGFFLLCLRGELFRRADAEQP
jgi:acyl-[acyl-carrier-protein]-phospholipid O-acyltransferase/long-chain-fatty-acid--[acyl-carrier-protein] ligase